MHDENVNYKEMYFHLFRAVDKAVTALSSAMLECEEMYLSDTDSPRERYERLLAEYKGNDEDDVVWIEKLFAAYNDHNNRPKNQPNAE